MVLMQEDGVRRKAEEILGLTGVDPAIAIADTGQITTMNSMADDYGFTEFRGIPKAPDGWYFPRSVQDVALVLEVKKENAQLGVAAAKQLQGYMELAEKRYAKVVGVLYNGDEVRVWCGRHNELPTQRGLQRKEVYLGLFEKSVIDKNRIYELTAKINNMLHFQFGVKNLNHRMIFTACALVAKRYDAWMVEGMDYQAFKQSVTTTLRSAMQSSGAQNDKLALLLEVFDEIKMSTNVAPSDPREQARLKALLWEFIGWVVEISNAVNSDLWAGEDVMGIFFNEFNRYKAKAEAGQVFTPEHITDFIYKITRTDLNDRVLDATCGSGAFLVKSMANMIDEAGGVQSTKAEKIKAEQLYGIEFDREIFALACANMLIHKDGKTNLEHMDARSDAAAEWISQQSITKVLMNPPYENKYGCIKIVENVLDSVPVGTTAAFILPDKKLEKTSAAQMKRILGHHRLTKVIKLPEDLFFGVGVTTSVFIFETGKPQADQEFMACYMASDGLSVVKNKGRHDVHGSWASIEAEWVRIVERQSGHDSIQWNKPVVGSCLSWQEPVEAFSITREDLMKTAMDYIAYTEQIDMATLQANVLAQAFYGVDEKTEELGI